MLPMKPGHVGRVGNLTMNLRETPRDLRVGGIRKQVPGSTETPGKTGVKRATVAALSRTVHSFHPANPAQPTGAALAGGSL
jgi:hypothetical protein